MFRKSKQETPTKEAIEAAAEKMQKVQREKDENKNSDKKIKTYLKALPLQDYTEIEYIKKEITTGNIIILRITPLANKSIEKVKQTVNELCSFVKSLGGDIARLGDERIVICPPNIRIWREKKSPLNNPIPTT